MSGSTTPYYSFNLPTIGGNQDTWGNLLNANWTAADSAIHGLASGYLPVGGGGITGNLNVTGDLGVGGAAHVTGNLGVDGGAGVAGNLGAATISTTGAITCGGALLLEEALIPDFKLSGSSTSRSVQFATGYIYGYNATTHNQEWWGNGNLVATMGQAGDFSCNASVSCSSTGVRYTNIGANGFNFRWGSPTAYIRVDNAVEIGIQPVSDERAKADIAPSTFDCLTAVLATPLFQFRWKTLGQTPNLETATVAQDAPLVPIGFVAQRQQAVFPASVIPGGDTGRSADGATTLWQMDHNALCAALCGAVQQLAEMNKELAMRVSDLEALRLA